MVTLSENIERGVVAIGGACGAAAAYIASSTLPQEVKLIAVPILGVVAVSTYAFWSKWVNPSSSMEV